MWIEANGDVGEAAHHDNKYQRETRSWIRAQLDDLTTWLDLESGKRVGPGAYPSI